MNFKITKIKSYPSDLGTTQTLYEIDLFSPGIGSLSALYLNTGNNAEYESSLKIKNVNTLFIIALHEFLDYAIGVVKVGSELQYYERLGNIELIL